MEFPIFIPFIALEDEGSLLKTVQVNTFIGTFVTDHLYIFFVVADTTLKQSVPTFFLDENLIQNMLLE